MGLYNQAIPALVSAENSLAKTNPPDPRLPQIQIALGDMASAENRTDLAEKFYKKALISSEHLAVPSQTLVRNSLVHGGNFYLHLDRPAEALPLLLRAAAISERASGFPRTLYAIDLDNLAQAHMGLGREKEGRVLCLQALQVLDNANSETEAPKARGIIYFNLGVSHEKQHENAEAESYFKKSLEVLSPRLGPKAGSPGEIRTLVNEYAGFLRGLGRIDEAIQIETRLPKPILQ
jgi:tetratricopeptide (TPR) repeat protein